jgi:peptidoglycan-associated lipoprotein
MKRTTVVLLMLILVLSIFSLYGCPKSADVSSAPESQPQKVEKTPEAAAAEAAKAAEEKKAAEDAAAKAAAEEAAAKERAAKEAAGLKAIYFDFDKSFVRDDAKAVMKANAAWLKANPKTKVRIEGNCDERGTREYNFALGSRRANAVREFLIAHGVDGARVVTVSYGKERPVDPGTGEDAWQHNRNAHTNLTSGAR